MSDKREVCNLALGTVIEGDLRSDNHIRLEGKITGNVQCKGRLVLSGQAEIEGQVKCQTALVEGKITGNVQVDEELHLGSTARLVGDVQCSRLHIEPGAVFIGQCLMPGK